VAVLMVEPAEPLTGGLSAGRAICFLVISRSVIP
jgi:hypothetical protein